MPMVGKKKYPYTKEGMAEAAKARKKKVTKKKTKKKREPKLSLRILGRSQIRCCLDESALGCIGSSGLRA